VVRLLGGVGADAHAELRAEQAALLAHATYALGRHAEARSLLTEAGTLPIDPAGPAAARLAIETAAFRVNVDGEIVPALALLDEALARRPAASAEAMALRTIREAVALLAAQDADIGFLRSAADAAVAAGAYASAADLARVVSFALLMWSGAEADLAFLDHTGRRFDAAGVSEVGLELLAERVQAAVLAGHLDDAVAFGDEILERPAPLRARQSAAIFRARALGMMGRLDEAQAGLAELDDRLTDDFVGRGESLAVGAEIALWSGLPERAIQLASEVRSIPSPIMNAYGLPDLTRAWARLELGTAPGPLEGVVPTRIMAGAIPEAIAMTDLHEGRSEVAADGFARAADLWRGFHEPRAMFCRWAQGEALRRAGRDEMAACLHSVMEDAIAGGYGIIALRARRSLRQAGLRTTGDRPTMPGGRRLTARERELLDLVGRGLTNIEIARRMGLGRPTVSRILSNAMSKLGATSRAHAVVLAAEGD
jgi:DNA-binding CsgD family transcriptional regulator